MEAGGDAGNLPGRAGSEGTVKVPGCLNRNHPSRDWGDACMINPDYLGLFRFAYYASRSTLREMIQSFKDAATQELFEKGKSRRWANVERVAKRKLDQLEAAVRLSDLRAPPNSRLEALSGDRKGQHSIRVNDQYRICFVWRADGAQDVEVTDYH